MVDKSSQKAKVWTTVEDYMADIYPSVDIENLKKTLCRLLSLKDDMISSYPGKNPNYGRILVKYDNDQFAHWRERSIKNTLKFFYGKRGFHTMSEESKITEGLIGICFAKGREKYEAIIQHHNLENPDRPWESAIRFAVTVS